MSYFARLDPANNVVHRLFEQLKAQGFGDEAASEIAIAKSVEHGNFDRKAMELTGQGRERSRMGAAGRAIDRAAKAAGRHETDYRYNPKTNRATLKGKPSGGRGGVY